MTTTTKVRIRWTAGREARIAHAHRGKDAARALCHEPGIRERDAWPPLRRCRACELLVDELGTR